jgi:putative nucleotidyltransferase with HDIG domain
MAATMTPQVLRLGDARSLAAEVLADEPERWRHTVGVAHRAEDLARTIGTDDPVVLLSAAWLHDIGYAAVTRDTGFHPVDGARFLRRLGWPRRVVALVANHSGARFVADARGLAATMDEFPDEQTALSESLTYADLTVGPYGRPMSLPERMAEMLGRHGPDSPNARAHVFRGPYLTDLAGRVERRLARSRPNG